MTEPAAFDVARHVRRTVPVCLPDTDADVVTCLCEMPETPLADPNTWGAEKVTPLCVRGPRPFVLFCFVYSLLLTYVGAYSIKS